MHTWKPLIGYISIVSERDIRGRKMPTQRKIITSPFIRPIPLPLSQGVQIDNTLYISGQLGTDYDGNLPEGIRAQATQALNNIGHILTAAGSTFGHVFKVTVLLADIADYSIMNEVYALYFKSRFPARVAYAVRTLPIEGGLVEIEAIAVVGEIIEA